MKHILLSMSLIIGSTSVKAETIMMKFDYFVYKFSSGFFSTTVLERVDLDWIKFCKDRKYFYHGMKYWEETKDSKLSISDTGVTCNFTRMRFFKDGSKKAVTNSKTTLDFILLRKITPEKITQCQKL